MRGDGGAVAVIGWDPSLVGEVVGRGLRPVMVRDVRAHLRGASVALPEETEEVVVEDITDVGDVWAGLIRHFGDRLHEELRGIVTFEEFSVSTVAALTSLMDLPGTRPERAVLMRDKHLQKQAVLAAGVPAAASRLVVPGSDLVRMPFPGPCVIKPVAGGGAVHTEVVRTEAEYEVLLERLAASATSPFVVEDLVDVAQEWIVDGAMQDGAVAFSSVGRYAAPCLNYTTDAEPMHIYRVDGTGEDERCAEARAVAGKALQALGHTDGVFHMELLLDRSSDTFFFGEVAARVGGGLIQEAVLLKHGFSLAGAAVDVALGRPVRSAGEPSDRCVAMTTLHLPRGTIVKLPNVDHFTAAHDIHELRIVALLGVNDPPEVRTTIHRQGMSLVSAASPAELDARMAAVRREFAEQSLVAPTFGTGVQQRAFLAGYEDAWRRQL
ncbi:ATP-grasp domain-containing protein [Streptomyces canus]|uniref:ATP-grasp domain-containing protein n=1 Tax=Streptomyces canus TaxID=58343 RepID=UPI00131BB3BC|nr:hypothetical protein [Streptomyces canus]